MTDSTTSPILTNLSVSQIRTKPHPTKLSDQSLNLSLTSLTLNLPYLLPVTKPLKSQRNPSNLSTSSLSSVTYNLYSVHKQLLTVNDLSVLYPTLPFPSTLPSRPYSPTICTPLLTSLHPSPSVFSTCGFLKPV